MSTDSLIPIIRQMHDAPDDRARAAILLAVSDALLAKYRGVFEGACRRAAFDAGLRFINVRRAQWCATRGRDGLHTNALFEEVRAEFAAYAAGGQQ